MVIAWVVSGYCRRCRWLPPEVIRESQSMLRSINQSIFISELYIYFTFAHINVKMNII